MVKSTSEKWVENVKYGYARVSTRQQDLEGQLRQLEEEHCDKIFFEKITGTKSDRPEFQKLLQSIQTGDRTDFEVLGWIDASQGLIGSYADIYVADTIFATFSDFNTTRSFDIEIEPSKLASATTALNLITNSNEYLNAENYQDQLKKWESTLNTISLIGYSFMAIIGGVGVMSLINTVVNSIYSRKRELGIIQALGMTEKQLIKMLQFEGLVYTLGTVLLSLTLGNLLGFLAYRFAVVNSLFNIKTYVYPWAQTLLLVIVVIGVQLILTVLVSRSFRKESLVERMRFAE